MKAGTATTTGVEFSTQQLTPDRRSSELSSPSGSCSSPLVSTPAAPPHAPFVPLPSVVHTRTHPCSSSFFLPCSPRTVDLTCCHDVPPCLHRCQESSRNRAQWLEVHVTHDERFLSRIGFSLTFHSEPPTFRTLTWATHFLNVSAPLLPQRRCRQERGLRSQRFLRFPKAARNKSELHLPQSGSICSDRTKQAAPSVGETLWLSDNVPTGGRKPTDHSCK